MAIIIRDDSYDKLLTPLAFAYLEASEGTQVDMPFVNWSVLALTEKGAGGIRINGPHADQEAWVRSQTEAAGMPSDIYEILKALKGTGTVNLYACSLASKIFGVDDKNMIPEAEEIIGASWFLHEKALKADHYQYF